MMTSRGHTDTPTTSVPLDALLRHFGDLRDGTHGDATSRTEKERHFRRAVELLHPFAVQVLEEYDEHLLLGTGTVGATGATRDRDNGLFASWTLSWPEQRDSGISPITLHAHYGARFHHPHLRGATVAEWPLNVFEPDQAAELLPVLRAIAAADVHNLVYQRDFRIVPSVRAGGRSAGSEEEY